MTNRFDEEALEWDKNADIIRINESIAKDILPSILTRADTVLEVGCGTGILSFMAYGDVAEWFGVDTSPGMISMFNHKLASLNHHDQNGIEERDGQSDGQGRSKLWAEEMYLSDARQLSKRYDWGVSAMTFHHIPDMQSTLTCLAQSLTKGLVVVDYAQWDGSIVFHPPEKMDGVQRHGLDAQELRDMCTKAGFQHVTTRVGFTLTLRRENRDVQFPFLVIEARH